MPENETVLVMDGADSMLFEQVGTQVLIKIKFDYDFSARKAYNALKQAATEGLGKANGLVLRFDLKETK